METFFSSFASVFLVLGLCFLVFLAIRFIMLWYWKIDTIVENQEKQLSALKAILHKFDDAIKVAKQTEKI